MLDKQLMIDSYRNTSFSSEKRGAQDFEHYSELLESDLKELGENTGNYKTKFQDKVMLIYSRKSRCASAFITGPANFNVSKNKKAWDSEQKAYDDFFHWRKKYFKAVNRVRTLSPEAEIDKTIKELDDLILFKTECQIINKAFKKDKEQAIELFNELLPNFKDKEYIIEKNGFPSYSLTSLTTKIRERKKKIEVMKNRIDAKENQKPVFFEGGSIYIDNDRVIIEHDEKPDKEIIKEIKAHGFRYSPKTTTWVRKHTGNARYNANLLLKNVLGGEIEKS